jgi:Domain of unknown function (DUF2019)
VASPLQLASSPWQYRFNAACQQTRPVREQPVEAPHLVGRFRELALDKSKALLDSNTLKANRIFDGMQAIDQELRRRGPEARKALAVLLDDRDMRVRYEAAIELLAVVPNRALATIRAIANRHLMPVSGEAGMTLDRLEDGTFKPD